VLLATFIGCAPHTLGKAEVTGTLHGADFHVVEAISATAAYGDSGFGLLVLADREGACRGATETPVSEPPFLQSLVFTFLDRSGGVGKPPSAPGTFQVWSMRRGWDEPPHAVVVQYAHDDATCHDAEPKGQQTVAESGSVRIDRMVDGAVEGAFDLLMVTRDAHEKVVTTDQLTGTFSTASCPAYGVAGAAQASDHPPRIVCQ
jgi:hypothetical protein